MQHREKFLWEIEAVEPGLTEMLVEVNPGMTQTLVLEEMVNRALALVLQHLALGEQILKLG